MVLFTDTNWTLSVRYDSNQSTDCTPMTFLVIKMNCMYTWWVDCSMSYVNCFLIVPSYLIVFVLREYILKVHVLVSFEHKLCQIWNTCIVFCILLINCFFKHIVDIFFSKDYYQESYILIIEHISVVTQIRVEVNLFVSVHVSC
jgi:hypothetical protein